MQASNATPRYRLFIDDLRDPVKNDWTIVRTSSEAMTMVSQHGCPFEISFDHDLGGDDTAMIFVHYLIGLDMDHSGQFIPSDFQYSVHSANPVGRNNIIGLLSQYLNTRNK